MEYIKYDEPCQYCKKSPSVQYIADCQGDGEGRLCLGCWKRWVKDTFLPYIKEALRE